MQSATRAQLLEEVVCNSLYANAFGKGTNSALLPLRATLKQTGFLSLEMATKLGEEKQFKPALLHLKIQIVTHPTCDKGVGKYIH